MSEYNRMPIISDVCAELKDVDGESFANLFVGRVENGDLATAEEIAGVFVEVLKLRRDRGRDMIVPLAQWQSQLALLQLILADEHRKAIGFEKREDCSKLSDVAFGPDNRQTKMLAPDHPYHEQLQNV